MSEARASAFISMASAFAYSVMATALLAFMYVPSVNNFSVPIMAETPRRRITIRSSSVKYPRISWEIGVWGGGGRVTLTTTIYLID
jgi:hypothetical protein